MLNLELKIGSTLLLYKLYSNNLLPEAVIKIFSDVN